MSCMEALFVADVGDGLCALYQAADGERILTDCGSYAPKRALRGLQRSIAQLGHPRSIILSHLHADHYSGFVLNGLQRSITFQVNTVHYPRIPQFPQQRDTFIALMTVNARVLGRRTGVAEYEFLQTIASMNDRDLHFRAVTQGDLVAVGGAQFEILWPPRVLPNREDVRARIRHALDMFNRAVDQDPQTRELYERVEHEGMFERVQVEGAGVLHPATDNHRAAAQRADWRDEDEAEDGNDQEERELPQVVRDASEALRHAANDFSIAARNVRNSFVFMGDLEEDELPDVVNLLAKRGCLAPDYVVTPHHGTHWHDTLLSLHATNSLTSNGPRWAHKWQPLHKRTAVRTLATHVDGDLSV